MTVFKEGTILKNALFLKALEEGFDDTTPFASVRRFICKQEFHDMPELVLSLIHI